MEYVGLLVDLISAIIAISFVIRKLPDRLTAILTALNNEATSVARLEEAFLAHKRQSEDGLNALSSQVDGIDERLSAIEAAAQSTSRPIAG